MWFKGISFVSYTVLLVAPTNAAFRGRDGVAYSGRNRVPVRRNHIPYLHGRQKAWRNETRSSVVPKTTISEPVVIVTSDPAVTSTDMPTIESSSAIATEPTLLTTASAPELPLATSSVLEVEEPVFSSEVLLPTASSSGVKEQPATSTVPSSFSQIVSSINEKSIPSTTAITTLDRVPTSTNPMSTSESVASSISESQPSTTAPPTVPSSTLTSPITSSSIPFEEPSQTIIISSSSSTPISSAVPAPPQAPQQPEPSPTQQISSNAEQQPSATSLEKGSTSTSDTLPVLGLKNTVPAPSSTLKAKVIESSSSTAGPISSQISDGPVVMTSSSIALPADPIPTESHSIVTSTSATGLLPLPTDIQNLPSNILSEISFFLSSVLDPSKILGSTSAPVSSATQAWINFPIPISIPSDFSIPTIPEATSRIDDPSSPTSSEMPTATNRVTISTSTSIPTVPKTKSSIGNEPSSVNSKRPTSTRPTSTNSLTVPTSESGPIVIPPTIDLPVISQTIVLFPTGVTSSGGNPSEVPISGFIPSETLSIPTTTLSLRTSTLDSNSTGIFFSGVSGTGLPVTAPLAPSFISSRVSISDPRATTPIYRSNIRGSVTISEPGVSTPPPINSLSFGIFDPSAPTSVNTANKTGVATPTGIPTSETRSIPTTGIKKLPSGSVSISGIISSGIFGPGTTGGETARPTEVFVKETSAALLAIPTSDTISAPDAKILRSTDLPDTLGVPSPSSTPSSGNKGPVSTTLPTLTTLPTSNNGAPSPTDGQALASKTAPHATSSIAAAPAETPPPAPLNKSQTVGIAVGGTTCLLVALVAALFIARRYHTNAVAKRKSGGVYPEVAYLYDPPTGGRDAEAGGGIPAMSGGATGYGPYGAVSPNSPHHSALGGQRNSAGNPFDDPAVPNQHLQNISQHTDTRQSAWPVGDHGPHGSPVPDVPALPFAAAVHHTSTDTRQSAWPTGDHGPHDSGPVPDVPALPFAVPHHNRTESTVSAWPAGNQDRSAEPSLSPVAIPKSSFQNVAMAQHGPTESSVSAWSHNSKSMPETNNPFLDSIPEGGPSPPRIEGPVGDSMGNYVSLAVNPYALHPHATEYPPLSPYGPAFPAQTATRDSDRYSDPFSDPFEHDVSLNVNAGTEASNSITIMAPSSTPGRSAAAGRYTPEPASVSNTNLLPIARVPVGRNTPSPDGRYTPTPDLTRSGQTTLNNSPIMGEAHLAQVVPVHKGWDDIKMDNPVLHPQPLAPGIKKKPLPGAGQVLLQGPGLPLVLKRKDVGVHNKDNSAGSGFGLEVPFMYGSPGPSINDFSDDLLVQRKREGELLFADPQLVGKQF